MPKTVVSYIRGVHQFKFGTDLTWEEGDTRVLVNKASGNYLLFFNNGLPAQIQLFNFPVTPTNRLFSQAAFVTDTWKYKRLALTGGLRWEYEKSVIDKSEIPAGRFIPARSFAQIDCCLLRFA